ncbi:MAG: hypothetical protein RhofKO_13260 [Rhodothermales bacterium]
MEEPLMEKMSAVVSASKKVSECYFKAIKTLESGQHAFESPYGAAVISPDSSLDVLHVRSAPELAEAWHLVGHKPRMVRPSTHPVWAPFVEDVYSVAWESANERIVDWMVTPRSPFLLRGTRQLNRMMRRVSLQLVEEEWVLHDTLSPGDRLNLMHLDLYRRDSHDRQRALLKITWGPLKAVTMHDFVSSAEPVPAEATV